MFRSLSELQQQRQALQSRKSAKQDVDQDEPLSIDLKINGLQPLVNVPIQGVGVFSYRAELTQHSPLGIMSASSDKKPSGGLWPFGGSSPAKQQEESKLADSEQRVGVIVNIRIQDQQKIVSVESLLLIANNHEKETLQVYVKEQGQDDN